MKKLFLFAIIIQLSIGFSACKKDEDPIAPEPEEIVEDPLPFENTKVLDEQTRNIISSIDTIDFTFVLSGESELSKDFAVGDIIVDSTSDKAPYGYLRRITSVESKKGELTLQTEQATLTDALEVGSIRFNSGRVKQSQIQKIVLSEGVSWVGEKNPNFSVFSFDYSKTYNGEYGDFTMEGHTSLDMEFFFDFDWKWEWTPLPHPVVDLFETGVIIDQMSSMNTVATGQYEIDERYSLAKFYLTPWTFMIGPVPVAFYPQIELFMEIDGSMTAEFTASASEDFNARMGVSYKSGDGWDEIGEHTYHSDFTAPNMTMDINYEAHVGPEISLLLYGVAGPFANATGCANLSSHLEEIHGLWTLDFVVGAQAEVGIKIDVLGFSEDWSTDFCLFQDTLLHYDNEPFGNAIYIESPANNTFHVLGNDIQVVTSYTGSTPDAVNFYIDGEKVAEDNEAPYEYIWETEGFNAGEHVIMVKEMLGGIKISEDEATITLQEVFWSEIDLSNLGVDANTRCTDIVYYSSTEAWICTSAPGQGKVLRTYDGGTTWVEVSTTPLGLEQMLVFNDAGQGLFLTQNHKVFYTEDGGETVAELEYGNEYYSQPTFQWKEIFGFGTNLDGEIVAVGKDTGIPYQFEVYRANAASHEPISDYEIPHPNEYGYSPSIYLRGAEAIVYGIQDEDQPNSNYYLTSNDGGVTWANHQFNGLTQTDYLKDASILNESEWWIVGENSTGQALVLISSNAGQSWENVVLDEVAGFNSVHFLDSNEGYATINKSTSVAEPKVYQTLDGGHTWQPVFGLNSTYGMGKVSFLGDQIGVVVGQGPIIYKFGVGK